MLQTGFPCFPVKVGDLIPEDMAKFQWDFKSYSAIGPVRYHGGKQWRYLLCSSKALWLEKMPTLEINHNIAFYGRLLHSPDASDNNTRY